MTYATELLLDISLLNLSFSGNQVLSEISFGVGQTSLASVIGPKESLNY